MEKYKDERNIQLPKRTEEKKMQTDSIGKSRNVENLHQTIKIVHYMKLKGHFRGVWSQKLDSRFQK